MMMTKNLIRSEKSIFCRMYFYTLCSSSFRQTERFFLSIRLLRASSSGEKNEFNLHIHTIEKRDSDDEMDSLALARARLIRKKKNLSWWWARSHTIDGDAFVVVVMKHGKKNISEFMVDMATWNSFQFSIYSSFYNVSLSFFFCWWSLSGGDHREWWEVRSQIIRSFFFLLLLSTVNVNLNLLSVSQQRVGCCDETSMKILCSSKCAAQ